MIDVCKSRPLARGLCGDDGQELRRRRVIGLLEVDLAGSKSCVDAALDRALVDGDGVAATHILCAVSWSCLSLNCSRVVTR
jgi:hypothetical protein